MGVLVHQFSLHREERPDSAELRQIIQAVLPDLLHMIFPGEASVYFYSKITDLHFTFKLRSTVLYINPTSFLLSAISTRDHQLCFVHIHLQMILSYPIRSFVELCLKNILYFMWILARMIDSRIINIQVDITTLDNIQI